MTRNANIREEFMVYYRPVQDRLARYARAITHDREEARDLVAETTLQAYEGFETLRDRTSFLSWVFTIATRLSRKKGIRAKYHTPWIEEKADTLRSSLTSPDASAEVRLLYEALERLPAEQREAVTLFEIADLPLKEIARIQGVSLSGAKARVTRGRARLGRILGVPESNRDTDLSDRSENEPGQILFINAA